MRFVFAVVSSLFVVALAASGAAQAGPPAKSKAPKLTAEIATKGRATYQTLCVVCHGVGGAGDGITGKYLNPPPRNFAKEPFKQGDSVDAIFATLQTGVPGTPMVAYPQLSEDDRWAVAWYVAHFRTTKEGKGAKKIVDGLPPLPTTAPTSPTTAPTSPTTAPTSPTTAPTSPTTAPLPPSSTPASPTTAPTTP